MICVLVSKYNKGNRGINGNYDANQRMDRTNKAIQIQWTKERGTYESSGDIENMDTETTRSTKYYSTSDSTICTFGNKRYQRNKSSRAFSGVRLPRINLPKFNSDVTKYQQYMQSFKCSIEANESLSNVNKLNY